MPSQLQVFLLPANFESDGITSHKHGLAAVAFFETNFFRIAGSSEAKSWVSEKAECLLAIGEDEKSKLVGVTFSFK